MVGCLEPRRPANCAGGCGRQAGKKYRSRQLWRRPLGRSSDFIGNGDRFLRGEMTPDQAGPFTLHIDRDPGRRLDLQLFHHCSRFLRRGGLVHLGQFFQAIGVVCLLDIDFGADLSFQ